MIEFNGYISGDAQKYFFRKSRMIASVVFMTVGVLLLPAAISFNKIIDGFNLLLLYICFFVFIFVGIWLPKTKKGKQKILPKKIAIVGESVYCTADTYSESKYVEDVKCVKDHGSFYELVYPFGKISEKYICQKDLLTVGSIEDFENLFKDKIVRIK